MVSVLAHPLVVRCVIIVFLCFSAAAFVFSDCTILIARFGDDDVLGSLSFVKCNRTTG